MTLLQTPTRSEAQTHMPRKKRLPAAEYHKAVLVHATQTELLPEVPYLWPAPDIKLFSVVYFEDGSSGTVTGVIHRQAGWLYEVDCGRLWAYSYQFLRTHVPDLVKNRPEVEDIPF